MTLHTSAGDRPITATAAVETPMERRLLEAGGAIPYILDQFGGAATFTEAAARDAVTP